MVALLGNCLAYWLIYAVLASAFKHKAGLLIISTLSVMTGFAQLMYMGEVLPLIAAILTFVLIYTIVPLQIKSEKKQEWKERRASEKRKK